MLQNCFNKNLNNFLINLDEQKNLVIALSGGSDSMALLHLANSFVKSQNIKTKNFINIRAIHINHGISAKAFEWEQHCKDWCAKLAIKLDIFRIKIETGTGIEERARKARYDIFIENLSDTDILLMGHHQDDALETFFLNLFRGSGTRGLASIPNFRPLGKGLLYRPILNVAKQDILLYLSKTNLTWVDDDSNQDTSILRNFLRIEILPKLESKFKNIRKNFVTSIELSKDAEILLGELACEDLKKLEFDFNQQSLKWSSFCKLSDNRRNNVLRYLQKIYQFAPISAPMLKNLNSKINANLNLSTTNIGIIGWADVELRQFNDKLYIGEKRYFAPLNKNLLIKWNGAYGAKNLENILEDIKTEFLPNLPIGEYKITARKSASVIFYKGMHRKTKKLLQEKNIAPWVREQLPFIWQADQLIAIGNLIIADNLIKPKK